MKKYVIMIMLGSLNILAKVEIINVSGNPILIEQHSKKPLSKKSKVELEIIAPMSRKKVSDGILTIKEPTKEQLDQLVKRLNIFHAALTNPVEKSMELQKAIIDISVDRFQSMISPAQWETVLVQALNDQQLIYNGRVPGRNLVLIRKCPAHNIKCV